MKTAIIIPTHNRPSMVERLLDNMRSCSFPSDVEICIVENGPACGVEDICKSFSLDVPVRYLYVPASGKSLAQNHGIAFSDADFFIFLDDDIRVSTDIIETYVYAARRYGPGFFFGGPLFVDAEIQCPSHLVPHLPFSAKGRVAADHEMGPSRFEYCFWRQLGGLSVGPEIGSIRGRSRRHSGAEWVWRRTFRQGVTEWILTKKAEQGRCRKFFGIPAWMMRAAIAQKIKVATSRLRHLPIEQRTEIEMQEAYLAGLIYGAWTGRR